MGRHHHPAGHALKYHRYLWAEVSAAHDLALLAAAGTDRGLVQTRMNKWMIEHGVLFASGHKGEAIQGRRARPQCYIAYRAATGSEPFIGGFFSRFPRRAMSACLLWMRLRTGLQREGWAHLDLNQGPISYEEISP